MWGALWGFVLRRCHRDIGRHKQKQVGGWNNTCECKFDDFHMAYCRDNPTDQSVLNKLTAIPSAWALTKHRSTSKQDVDEAKLSAYLVSSLRLFFHSLAQTQTHRVYEKAGVCTNASCLELKPDKQCSISNQSELFVPYSVSGSLYIMTGHQINIFSSEVLFYELRKRNYDVKWVQITLLGARWCTFTTKYTASFFFL